MSADEPTCSGSTGPLDEAGGLRECAACRIRFRPENESDLLCWLCSVTIDRDNKARREEEDLGWFE
jgi:hypothetical protein